MKVLIKRIRSRSATVWRRVGVRRAALVVLLPFIGLIVIDASVATAVAAAFALLGAVWTLSQAEATARRTLTAEYRGRWDHSDLLDARIATSDFLSLRGTDADARWHEWEEWLKTGAETKKRLQVMGMLNYWEQVASAYNQGFLDRAWFRTDLAWLLKHNWDRAGWFIRKFRVEYKNAAFFCEWQKAVEVVGPDLERQREEGEERAREALARGDDLLHFAQRAAD